MSNGEFFAILHKPTGGYLPELCGNGRKISGGYTHTEPSTDFPPRLFMTARAARNALTWWLKGVTVVSYSTSYEGEVDESMETHSIGDLLTMDSHTKAALKATNVGTRKAEEMEVVPVLLLHVLDERV